MFGFPLTHNLQWATSRTVELSQLSSFSRNPNPNPKPNSNLNLVPCRTSTRHEKTLLIASDSWNRMVDIKRGSKLNSTKNSAEHKLVPTELQLEYS
ncbi:hypothetical protein ACLKA7_011519 [Drosophila subpalustris]